MSTNELPLNESEAPEESEPRYGGKDSRRRIYRLLEELFGDSRHAQIQGLLLVRKNAQIIINNPTNDELKAAYARGRADLQAEIVFAERLAAIRAKYPDFDSAWASVRPLVPRVIWQEAADHPEGLEGVYQLARLPELCQELSEMEPERARERFKFFVKDLTALTRGAIQ
jgi:hypothetical protein